MTSAASGRPTVVVIGHGMVSQRFLECAVARGLHVSHRFVVIGEENWAAYDRVHLSAFFDGTTAEELSLTPDGFMAQHGIELSLGTRALSIDRVGRTVKTDVGELVAFDTLVLATGSKPFVPPIDGNDAPGTFVYRTIDDLEAIADYAAGCRTGAVVGGGLLGLEAANALRLLGLTTHVVEFAPRLMPAQLDEGGSSLLRKEIEALDITVHCSKAAAAIVTSPDRGVTTGLSFADGSTLDADLVLFSAGIRPRDELPRDAGLAMGERGGVMIDDHCQTSDSHIFAIGEVACHSGKVYGLVAPGYLMAETAASVVAGEPVAFTGADTSTKLKLIGVDVASIGDAHAATPGAQELVYTDPRARTYQKLVLDQAGKKIIGAVLVGDVTAFTVLAAMVAGTMATPRSPESLVLPSVAGASPLTPAALPDAATICSCHNVTKGLIVNAIKTGDLCDLADVKACTKAGTGCGSCTTVVKEILNDEMTKAGRTVSTALCEHFAYSRQELFDLVRVQRIGSFRDLIAKHGTGRGCEICKPAVGSMLASLGNGYILDGEQATLQDTNDAFLANIQRDGTYSVIPRIPGGEITPEKLIVIGEVARDFDLYTKITGGQRIDLLGARLEQLPLIWDRLIQAGFESGHAYGKALRTVKSCVGSTWCRYGVQDSVGLAVRTELRYRGLRSPHKIKMAVSGCARECAEAQSKDIGIIATENGYNLYIGGNGGLRPQHAVLFATDLDADTLLTYVDRILMFYIRTADRLERTATWLNKLDGGVDYLREVVIEDSLGLADDLDAQMATHVATYECEWAAALASPDRLDRFVTFANTPDPDSTLVFVRERDQRIPTP
jgi:nitrite reductase (NADH) large subunit